MESRLHLLICLGQISWSPGGFRLCYPSFGFFFFSYFIIFMLILIIYVFSSLNWVTRLEGLLQLNDHLSTLGQ